MLMGKTMGLLDEEKPKPKPKSVWRFNWGPIRPKKGNDHLYHDRHEGLTEDQKLAELNRLKLKEEDEI
jgi:hypothetical protein